MCAKGVGPTISLDESSRPPAKLQPFQPRFFSGPSSWLQVAARLGGTRLVRVLVGNARRPFLTAGDPGSNPALGKHGYVITQWASWPTPTLPMLTFATRQDAVNWHKWRMPPEPGDVLMSHVLIVTVPAPRRDAAMELSGHSVHTHY